LMFNCRACASSSLSMLRLVGLLGALCGRGDGIGVSHALVMRIHYARFLLGQELVLVL
jgi:hypothetical protein